MTPQEVRDLAELLERVPGMRSLDLKDVRRLAQLLRDSPEIGSIELKGWFGTGVVITRTAAPAGAPLTAGVSFHPALAQPPASDGGARAVEPAPLGGAAPPVLKEIKSPMVGTFFKAPEPGAEAYVRVGARVAAGQTVCIIEAMKIMNEIEAEIGGVIREVLVEDTQPVEFGQVLFRVDPNG